MYWKSKSEHVLQNCSSSSSPLADTQQQQEMDVFVNTLCKALPSLQVQCSPSGLTFHFNPLHFIQTEEVFYHSIPTQPLVTTAHGKVLLAGDALGKGCYTHVQWQKQDKKRTNA